MGEVKEADQSVKNITGFAKLVELYQKKDKNCFRCQGLDHFI